MSKLFSDKFKSAAGIIIVFLAAFGGVYLGMKAGSGEAVSETAEIEPEIIELRTDIADGSQFPDVILLTERSSHISTGQFFESGPALVYFMEMGCPPCEEMTEQLLYLVESGKVSRESIFGITFAKPDQISKQVIERRLTFPVYADTGFTFVKNYGVKNFPLVMYVEQGGRVKKHSFDSRSPLDAEFAQKNRPGGE